MFIAPFFLRHQRSYAVREIANFWKHVCDNFFWRLSIFGN